MQSVVGMMQQAGVDGYDVTLALLGQDALITRSRNTLLAHFIAAGTATHILFIDNDLSFDAMLAGRLISCNKDVVAASYPLKTFYWDGQTQRRMRSGEPASSAALRYVGELCTGSLAERDGDLATATYVGTGFMLITRSAIHRMMDAYPQTRYKNIHAYDEPQGRAITPYALFECMIDPATQTYLSEDFSFCHRWHALGGKVWLDTRSCLTHSGQADFHGAPGTVFEPRIDQAG